MILSHLIGFLRQETKGKRQKVATGCRKRRNNFDYMHIIYDSIRSFQFYIVNQSSDIFEYHYFVSGLFKSEIHPFSNITIL